jgi:hypothetical protein
MPTSSDQGASTMKDRSHDSPVHHGHHAIINYFVLGDQIVMTPDFAGSEPVVATSGKYKGTVILQDEQNQGLAMIQGLSEIQRMKAILNVSKTGNNNLTEAFKDKVVLD